MEQKIRRAVYVGSFDPVTKGHMWVIEKASKTFDEVIVMVGINPEKKYKYSSEDRKRLIEEAIKDEGLTNVKVATVGKQFSCIQARLMYAEYIVKGIRDSADLDNEKKQVRANEDMDPDILTVFLIPPAALEYVSSSFVKGFIGYDSWEYKIRRYVPDNVWDFMVKFEERNSIQTS